MKLVVTARAEIDIERLITFGRSKFGQAVADRTLDRIFHFLEHVLLPYPRTGQFDPILELHACWIPKTPFVVFYRIDYARESLVIVAMLHHAQDRTSIDLGD